MQTWCVSGLFRKEQVDAIADGVNKLLPSSWHVKRNIMDLDETKLAVGNHGSLTTDQEVQCNLNREAKGKHRKDL